MQPAHRAAMSGDHLHRRFGLAQKKCLVTGGTKGIGKACVGELAALGASVILIQTACCKLENATC